MAKKTPIKSSGAKHRNDLLKRAQQVFVGGVNSPVRSMRSLGMQPLIIQKGKGAKLWDSNNKSYIDYVLSFGAMILGHDDLSVERAIKESAENGWHFGMTTPIEIELAEIIQKAVPYIEKIRFVNSGTEAVMGALRLARGVTGRKKIIKFKNAYHGHADYLLVKGGSGLASYQIPLSAGVPKEFYEQTIVAEYGDIDNLKIIFEQNENDIAAVIMEPVGGNYGVSLPDLNFIKDVRAVTKKYGTLLVFDEVITGFRFKFGAASDLFGITPDLICLGKIIGGGLPIGAYGGTEAMMNHLAPLGKVYQASTFAGNPLVMAAGKATLEKLEGFSTQYGRLTRYADKLAETFKEVSDKAGVAVTNFRSMFSIKFVQKEVFPKFYRRLLTEGVLLSPSEYEANFISFAHTQEDIEETKRAIIKASNFL